MAAEDGGQVLHYNITSTSITIPSTSVDMNGMLSAVSVCGDKSEPASFQGMIILSKNIHNVVSIGEKNYFLRFEKTITRVPIAG